MSGVSYRVQAVEFGEPITTITGKTTLTSQDYGVSLIVERTREDGGAESLVLGMSSDDAAALSNSLSDAVALARHKQFMSRRAV